MKFRFLVIFLFSTALAFGQSETLIKKVSDLKDSIKVGNLIIYNAFKYQVLAHQNNNYDSTLIVDKVYKPFPELWDNCLASIFGDAGKMFKDHGIVTWNKTLFENQPALLTKIDSLLNLNIDSLFNSHLKGIIKLTGYKPEGKWILYLGPNKDFSLEIGELANNFQDITTIKIAKPRQKTWK